MKNNKNLYLLLILFSLQVILLSCGAASDDSSSTDEEDDDGFRIFVTSESYAGNLGGLSGADEICQQHADDAGLEDTYKAILSDSTDDASERITASDAIYIYKTSSTKVKVVDNDIDLWNTSENDLKAKINYDENYNKVSVEPWTGSLLTGGVDSEKHCSDWSNNTSSFSGAYGDSDAKDSEWLSNLWEDCDSRRPIICISQ